MQAPDRQPFRTPVCIAALNRVLCNAAWPAHGEDSFANLTRAQPHPTRLKLFWAGRWEALRRKLARLEHLGVELFQWRAASAARPSRYAHGAYLERLAEAGAHRERWEPLKDDSCGMLSPGEGKCIKPVAPRRPAILR